MNMYALALTKGNETLLKQLLQVAVVARLCGASRPAVEASTSSSTKSVCTSGGNSSRGSTMAVRCGDVTQQVAQSGDACEPLSQGGTNSNCLLALSL